MSSAKTFMKQMKPLTKIISTIPSWIFGLLLVVCCILLFIYIRNIYRKGYREGIENQIQPDTIDKDTYIQGFLKKENRMFPFRYFTDKNGKVLPVVAVTGFFREEAAKEKYNEYKKRGIHIFGITAYKSFPNRQMLDSSEGEYERNDTFDYTNEIKDWLCCFKDKTHYGFTSKNNTIDISESDFYTSEEDNLKKEKKYDFIYICNKDSDTCPLNGWNAINRNFDLAMKCFPIMCNEYKLKGLIVGRVGCGLEEKYGDKMEVVDWLDWHILQDKMRESRILFVPNIYDASPRVVAESITKNLPVLMNRNILCGSKYITYETGELFSDEVNLRPALTQLLDRIDKISPKKWWSENYSQEKSQKKLCNFLKGAFPGEFDKITHIKFIL
jgi:hypothetical protein